MKREAMDYRDKVQKAFDDAKVVLEIPGLWKVRDLLAVEVPQPQHGDRWGDWVLDKRRLCLVYTSPSHKGWWYEVDIERETMQIWLENFASRARYLRGGDARSLGDLADALIDLRHYHLFPARRTRGGSGVKSVTVRA